VAQFRTRDARPEEVERLTELAIRSKRAWGYDDEFMRRVMPDMIVHRAYLENERGIVAEGSGGDLVGYAIVRVGGKTAYLRDLFIEPQHFRSGVGRMLFGAACEFARTHGAESLTLDGDPNAIGFYKRMGMRQVGSERSIAGRGRMLPVMQLDL